MNRRAFLGGAARLLVAGGAALAHAACAGSAWDEERIAQRLAQIEPDLNCSDTSGLWPAEIETRTANVYVARSVEPDQFCFNCTNFIEPQPAGCAGCKTVKGPIHPAGWCSAWTERA